MRKEKDNLQTAIAIVKFARSNDAARYNLNCYSVEETRVVATDGHRLAWQTFPEAVIEAGLIKPGLIDDKGDPAPEGHQFPDVTGVIPQAFKVTFHITGNKDGDWIKALKALSKTSDKPYGTIEANGDGKVWVRFKNEFIKASIELTGKIGPAYTFCVGVNLVYLYEALDACRRSDGRGNWCARVSLFDENSPIRIDNKTSGFYSLTMPLRVSDRDKDGFVTVRELKQAA